MSTASAKSVAIIGVGGIGTYILRAFLNLPNRPKIIVFTRSDSKGKAVPDDLASVPVVSVDYTDVAALTTLFKDHAVDVVISTVAGLPTAQKAQYSLADAAKAAGSVKLFAPSEWGLPTEGAKERGESNVFAVKDEFADYLKSIGLPYARFYTGLFAGYLPWLLALDVTSSVHIIGKGDKPLSLTSETDIGGFVAHVLTNYPLSSPELVNQSFRIQGQSITLSEAAQIYGKSIVYIAEGEQVPAGSEVESGYKTAMQTEVEEGRGSGGWDRRTSTYSPELAGSANKLWQGHVWQTLESIIGKN
ncbi:hypothetical protein BDP27DRAFT_1331919 [Rhodocollybia butyracea]|uniref:NmrA-like domain-containing protein n=1 Tax=Rhodocollybia butyracea TaxID=206335 RepID=A0A9P5PP57_9AGAR|nr:hypothetical protein BDP27DRAFT_1331919 [Rhodocollybia butyracea]